LKPWKIVIDLTKELTVHTEGGCVEHNG